MRDLFRRAVAAYGTNRLLGEAMAGSLGRAVNEQQISRWQDGAGPMPKADILVALISAATERDVDDLVSLFKAATPLRPRQRRTRRPATVAQVDERLRRLEGGAAPD